MYTDKTGSDKRPTGSGLIVRIYVTQSAKERPTNVIKVTVREQKLITPSPEKRMYNVRRKRRLGSVLNWST